VISDLSPRASDTLLQTISPAALRAVEYHDALIGLPHSIRGVLMFRNSSVIADAPGTLDDLIAAAQMATAGDVVGASLEYGFFFSGAHLNGLGGRLMDRLGTPSFNSEKGVEWLSLLDSFKNAGPTTYYTDDDVNLFRAGKAGIIIEASWNMRSLAEAVGAENLVIDSWPVPLSGYVQTENMYLSANALPADQNASWKFIEFFLSPEAQNLLTEADHIPAIVGTEIDDLLLSQAVDAMAGGAPFPIIPEMSAYWEPMEAALWFFTEEGGNPEAVLEQAHNSVMAELAELRGETLPHENVVGRVTLWHSWPEDEVPALTEVITSFQVEHPDVQFAARYLPPDDLRTKFEAAASSGRGPSALIGPAEWGPDLYDAQLVTDVTAFTTTSFLASINEAALGVVKYRGAIVGLPHSIQGVVMFRNRAIIPDAPTTYDELVGAAQSANAGNTVGASLEQGFLFSAAHLDGMGGMLMERNGDPAFNNAKGIQWLGLLDSFEVAGPTHYDTDHDLDLFRASKAGIIIEGTWNVEVLADAIGADNLVIDRWPSLGEDEGRLSGYVQAENIYLSANAQGDDRRATWEFMQYLLSPGAQATLSGAGRIPALATVDVSEPLLAQAMNALADGTPLPVLPEMDAYWEPMNAALRSVLEDGADPAKALQEAFDSISSTIIETRAGR
jgi:arabinogalactan oligomer/maltooligosaccharide transport system substrate-binding protein